MASHRYWRILFTGPGRQNGDIDLGWVKFFETVDIDATVAAAPSSTGGTAISGENYSSSYLPAKSFTYTNGETAANWASASQTSNYSIKWIGYDFGAGNAKDIVAYSIAYYSSYEPWEWQFQWSDDGSSWTTAHTVTGFRFNANTSHFFRCPSAPAGTGYRYWRVLGSGTGTTFSIGELSLRTTVGGSNVLSATYSSLYADSANGDSWTAYGPRKALDGTTGFLSNSWRSLANSSDHWLMVDFGKKISIAEAVVTCGPQSETRGIMKIQASNDQSTWTDFGSLAPFTADYSSQTLALSAPGGGLTRRRPLIICT